MNELNNSLYMALGICAGGLGFFLFIYKHMQARREVLDRLDEEIDTASVDHQIVWLPTTGKEVFTVLPLTRGRLYRVEIHGTWRYRDEKGRKRYADAFYYTDDDGNYSQRHHCLFLRSSSQFDWPPHLFEVIDRDCHHYSVLVDGLGETLSLGLRGGGKSSDQPLRVEVTLLSASAVTVTKRSEERGRRAAIEKIRVDLSRLRIESESQRNWGDPGFREDVSKHRTASLLREHERIREEFVSLHEKNPQLVAYMKEKEPDLYERLTGRLEAFLAAERNDARPVEHVEEEKPIESPPRRRLTAEEIRERIIRRVTVVTGDQKAVLESVLQAWEEQAEMLRQSGMEEEDITNTIGSKSEVLEEALGQLAESKEAKGGRRATTQSVA